MITLISGLYAVLKSRVGPYLCLAVTALGIAGYMHHDHTRLVDTQDKLAATRAALKSAQAQIEGLQTDVANTEQAMNGLLLAEQAREQTVTVITAHIHHAPPQDDGSVAPVLAETLASIAAAQNISNK